MSEDNQMGVASQMSGSASPRSFELLKNVPVQITVELGRKKMRLGDLLELGPSGVLELPTLVGDPLDIRVNDRLIARGEAVAIGDAYGVRILEIVEDDVIGRAL